MANIKKEIRRIADLRLVSAVIAPDKAPQIPEASQQMSQKELRRIRRELEQGIGL